MFLLGMAAGLLLGAALNWIILNPPLAATEQEGEG